MEEATFIATITKDFRIQIPPAVRNVLELEPGDQIIISIRIPS